MGIGTPEATLRRQSTELSDLIGSVQSVEATDRVHAAISARFGRGDTNRVDGAVEIFLPKAEKAGEDGNPRHQVEPLPDVTLEKVRMIGQVVEDFGRGEAISGNELLGLLQHDGQLLSQAGFASRGPPCRGILESNENPKSLQII